MHVAVFGATSAIANETAKLFAVRGASFSLVARRQDRLEAIREDLVARGAQAVHLHAQDLCELDKIPELCRAIEQSGGPVDVVLIAHGTLSNQSACQEDFSQLQREFATNFTSAAALLHYFANVMEERKRGQIAVVSSVAGDRGRQSNYVYGSAKAALSTFLSGLRNRLTPSGVQVLTVKPGFVDTPMTAHLKKGPLFVGPEVVAAGIIRALDKGRSEVYLPWFWAPIMAIIRNIPEPIFKRLRL